jgi:hypothetical protein
MKKARFGMKLHTSGGDPYRDVPYSISSYRPQILLLTQYVRYHILALGPYPSLLLHQSTGTENSYINYLLSGLEVKMNSIDLTSESCQSKSVVHDEIAVLRNFLS